MDSDMWLVFIVIAVAVGAIFYFGRSKNSQTHFYGHSINTRPKAARANPRKETYESEWWSYDFFWGPKFREGSMVIPDGLADISVAGINRADNAGRMFVETADLLDARMKLDRQTNNPHDSYAIAVLAKPDLKSGFSRLGFVPREIAREIRTTYSDDMPLSCEPRRAGWKTDGSACYLSINILAPTSARRKKYLLK